MKRPPLMTDESWALEQEAAKGQEPLSMMTTDDLREQNRLDEAEAERAADPLGMTQDERGALMDMARAWPLAFPAPPPGWSTLPTSSAVP